MPLDPKFVSLSKTARPVILKLARRQKLVDECFKAFQRQCYPGAPPAMVAEMRTCFFAGVAEMNALLM